MMTSEHQTARPSLVRPLPPGPLDIVGDVHGELEALRSLLRRLGYDAEGEHSQGRHLVFVGDLVDRGPDSPGVIRLVRQAVARGRASCVLGNHELNLLLREKKHGNHWFFGLHQPLGGQWAGDFPSLLVEDDSTREDILSFLSELPLALEREDVRVVHAEWHAESIAWARDHALEEIHEPEAELPEHAPALEALRALHGRLHDGSQKPEFNPLIAEYQAWQQRACPWKVLTSGSEAPVAGGQLFFAGNKWRFVSRVPWWESYRGTPVVVGHYWRKRELRSTDRVEVPRVGPHGWWGDVYCVDFSVGARYTRRAQGLRSPGRLSLAALRWPEQQVVFDDGVVVETEGPRSRGPGE